MKKPKNSKVYIVEVPIPINNDKTPNLKPTKENENGYFLRFRVMLG